MRDEARARLELVADTYLSVSTPVQQRRARARPRKRKPLRAPILARIRETWRRCARPRRNSATSVLDVEGGWSPCSRSRARAAKTNGSPAPRGEGVLVHPGFFFDFPREAFLVLSLLPAPAASRTRRRACATPCGAEPSPAGAG